MDEETFASARMLDGRNAAIKMKAIHGMGMDRNVTPWFCGRSPHGRNRVCIAAVGGAL